MRLLTLFIVLIIPFSFIFNLNAQNKESSEFTQGNLRFYLSEDKSSFAGLVMVNQLWTRYSWYNPGTVNSAGESTDGNFDIALRRSRLVFYTQLKDKFFMYTQLGYNGQTYISDKNPGVYLHNAITEYFVDKEKLHVGFGLHTWNGVSRYNNSKLLEFLVLDNPGFAYPTGGKYDQAGRQFGIYAKGNLSKLHYRISIDKPFVTQNNSDIAENRAVETFSEKLAYKGYFDWQFRDIESIMLPYMSMNNIGKKDVFNIGAGFYYQPDGTRSIQGEEIVIHNILLLGADVFYDRPLNNNAVLTFYLGIYNYDFGPNYLRASGKLNTGMGGSMQQGGGVSEWEIGTGNIARLEAGYLLPENQRKCRFQPFAGFSYKDFEALEESSLQYDLGANLLMMGNNVKWTLQYSSRPVYDGNIASGNTEISEYIGMLVLQTQIFF